MQYGFNSSRITKRYDNIIRLSTTCLSFKTRLDTLLFIISQYVLSLVVDNNYILYATKITDTALMLISLVSVEFINKIPISNLEQQRECSRHINGPTTFYQPLRT